MSSPAKRMRLSASRTSLSGRRSIGPSTNTSALPRASTSVMGPSNRNTSTQSTYDIITHEAIGSEPQASNQNKPPSRPASRSGSTAPPFKRTQLRQSTSQSQLHHPSMIPQPTGAIANGQNQEELLNLRAKANSLDYELKNLQSERGLLALQHEKELREAQSRADADYAKFQAAESERIKSVRHYEDLQKEVNDIRDRTVNEKASLERKIREIQGKFDGALEEKEEAEGRYSELAREYERFRVEEVGGKRTALESTLRETREELESYRVRFEAINKRLEEREHEVEGLERKAMELGTQAGGGEELEVLKREISEQVAYVRRLEGQVRDQNSELRKLRDERRAVSVVEEEKRALEVQMGVFRETEQRLNELEIQKEILEDEKRMWTSLLEREGNDSGETEFESPEAVVKALVNERIEHALSVSRIGAIESESSGKDETIRILEIEKSVLKEELDKAKSVAPSTQTSEAPDSKAYKRLERQRQLAAKEVEYLRAQLKTFDSEETMMMENANFDTQRVQQVKQLESLVDEYKAENQSLHDNLAKLESAPKPLEPRGTKRPAEEDLTNDNSSQVGPLLRKNKNLQTALQKVTSQTQQLATELQATKSQLKALRNSSKTRILELRDNPTAQAEATKMTTLRTLKEENAALMTQLRNGGDPLSSPLSSSLTSNPKYVPTASLDALTLDLRDKDLVIADKEKHMRRQREIWTNKAAEFRELISSVLGYRINFLPNGKVKVSSGFYRPPRSSDDDEDNEEDDDDDDPEHYILFDGEKGTMKISGGNDGDFGRDVRELVEFWVKGKGEIPCFLAAMTLEFYEKFGARPGGGGKGG